MKASNASQAHRIAPSAGVALVRFDAMSASRIQNRHVSLA